MIYNQTVAALVPIKEHSERISGKNFKDFTGKPLYHHIVETLDATYAVDEILIDTDSPRVVLEANDLSPKVRVIERPEDIRGDFVSMNKVIAYDLTQSDADIFVQTHATNPLLKPQTIAQALKAYAESEANDSLFTVNAYQSRFYTADGRPVNHDPEDLIRTQDLPPLYEENSCLYVFDRTSFSNRERRIGERPLMFPVDRIESIDIDDAFTFRLAEMLALYAHKGDA